MDGMKESKERGLFPLVDIKAIKILQPSVSESWCHGPWGGVWLHNGYYLGLPRAMWSCRVKHICKVFPSRSSSELNTFPNSEADD